jgi:hypothetical protein
MWLDQIHSAVDVNAYTETTPIVSESEMLQLKAYAQMPTVVAPQRALLETLETIAMVVDPDDIPSDVVHWYDHGNNLSALGHLLRRVAAIRLSNSAKVNSP